MFKQGDYLRIKDYCRPKGDNTVYKVRDVVFKTKRYTLIYKGDNCGGSWNLPMHAAHKKLYKI